jgi:hypothetical protein
MRTSSRRWIVIGAGALAAAVLAGSGVLLGLKHEPEFYRRLTNVPDGRRQAVAKQFVAESLRLRNDIVNEPRWEAVFSDEEVNAWLAEDLVAYFADQLPTGVRDPRVLFDDDRLTLAFQLDQGPMSSVVWAVVRAKVTAPNQLALTLEKVRAGALPMPTDRLVAMVSEQAAAHGVDLDWAEEDGLPVATLRYTAAPGRSDIVLDALRVLKGQIRLEGRSNHGGGVASPSLPTRKVLQSTFPRRNVQDRPSASLSTPRNRPPRSTTSTLPASQTSAS